MELLFQDPVGITQIALKSHDKL